MFKSVVFPAPEGPIMAVNSPDLNFPETPFKSCFLPVKEMPGKNKLLWL